MSDLPRWTHGVLGAHAVRIHEHLHAQVAIDRAAALGFREAAHRVEVVGLDAIEVVFRLRVHQAEHRVRVRAAAHVRDAMVVTRDRDVARLARPACSVGIRRVEGSARKRKCGEQQCELRHDGGQWGKAQDDAGHAASPDVALQEPEGGRRTPRPRLTNGIDPAYVVLSTRGVA